MHMALIKNSVRNNLFQILFTFTLPCEKKSFRRYLDGINLKSIDLKHIPVPRVIKYAPQVQIGLVKKNSYMIYLLTSYY